VARLEAVNDVVAWYRKDMAVAASRIEKWYREQTPVEASAGPSASP